MSLMRRCECCVGTGELESSDSGDESWWDCPTCKGTGEVADRRRPDQQLARAVEAERARILAVLRAGRRNPRGWWDEWDEAADYLEGDFIAKPLRGQ